MSSFRNEPCTDFSKPRHQSELREALESARKGFGRDYRLDISGKKIETGEWFDSINPSRPGEKIGRVAGASQKEVDQAAQSALKGQEAWRKVTVSERAEALFRVAEVLRKRRFELAALVILEAGKGWREADREVSKAIDFCEYYGREILPFSKPRLLGEIPGETNHFFYEAKGIAAVLSPWNAPLSDAVGMSVAALVTGNAVILSPAERTPVIGALLCEIYRQGKIPSDVFHFLPASGEALKLYLADHPLIDLIAFSGSREMGLKIMERGGAVRRGQRSLKRVIAEIGGRGAIIVDSDADLDEAIVGTIRSSFEYQGQKSCGCSRVIVLKDCYNAFAARLTEALKSLVVGEAQDPRTSLGPLIDEATLLKVREAVDQTQREGGHLLLRGDAVARSAEGGGFFWGPTLIENVKPESQKALAEIFGPLLCIVKASSFEDALGVANAHASLTGGIYSRSPRHIEMARENFRVGSLYINRPITGALVGRHPMGGVRISGTGAKAGGPDYLLHFMEPRTICENTMRRGFAPAEGDS